VGTPFNPEPNYFNSGAANFGIVQSRPAPVAQAAAAAQVRPIGQTWEQQQRQRGLTAANPSDINNVLTGQLPAGATVSGSQPPPAAKPNAPTQKGSFGTQTVVTPAQAFNYPDEIRPTPLNQSQETLSYVAPYVQEALQMLDNTLNAPAGLGSINKSQVDLLVQAGLLFDEADIAIAYDLAAGGDPSKYRTTPGGTPAADSTGGEWQPFATPPGGKFIMPEQMGGGKRGRSGAQTNAGRLSQWAGSGVGGFGPSLGLTQWRMNL
jgi:hypothetical protein